ncbi:MAG TPA: VWA domain-containing protein [Pyrinomonadaceae bacterium]|jgi:Ca-activated chloride channel family protein|nr:VWA domain-containing protein [Pyrinomonadaceae bacterium]
MLLPAATSKKHPSTRRALSLVLCAQLGFRILCALLALIAPASIHLQAQERATDDEIVRVNTDLLVFPIRVKDKRGPTATPLSERDLSLNDKDHVTAGLFLYHGADRVAIVFALDQSGSLREIVSAQREAALALVGRFGDASQVAVIRFAEKPSLVVPFGKDMAAAREAFNFPARANQHTAIFDAAAAAVNAFAGLTQIRSERRIVVLISDGLDNASTIKASAVIQSAMPNHVSFYVIHLPLFAPREGRLAVRSPTKGFRELAEKTGGKYFLVGSATSALALPANKTIDLTPVFQAIEEDLRSQYLLGFYAGEGSRDGRNHRFTIGLPAGVEYQMGGNKYARTQEFFHVVPGLRK